MNFVLFRSRYIFVYYVVKEGWKAVEAARGEEDALWLLSYLSVYTGDPPAGCLYTFACSLPGRQFIEHKGANMQYGHLVHIV